MAQVVRTYGTISNLHVGGFRRRVLWQRLSSSLQQRGAADFRQLQLHSFSGSSSTALGGHLGEAWAELQQGMLKRVPILLMLLAAGLPLIPGPMLQPFSSAAD